ncbi:Part of AAA domain-containing protein [Paenibacillus sp. 1_12]|uniref:nuclease-related domain-containing DEAD/DEAH box helicase n=1 Tax=Paenibacillus sp. 1_12 TaxID=1566278 RepID=UPI0008F3AF29|nr:NERD domain-containing protein [Paenibacillus sp. 1_12]SFK75613.1 Part of AAA domain-containing protein [Paenibacillus sp. 1_12]
MSRMIPPFYDERNTSDGEIKLFNALRKLPDEFVVLHSLGMANHRSKVFSEIDFVIICKEGILCLEVKGGNVFRREGAWHFVDRYGNENVKTKGPFDQVVGGMYSLRDHLKKHFGYSHTITNAMHACGVAFPDIPFAQKGPDIIPEIVYDMRNKESQIHDYVKTVFGYWRSKTIEKHGFEPGKIDLRQIDVLLNYLRGDFGYVSSLNHIIEQTEKNLLKLTEEQIDRLSMASENPRILLQGGAGTGKTLLALEHAKRAVACGKRVMYICFNKKLHQHLRYRIEQTDSWVLQGMHSGHFHGVLSDMLLEMQVQLPDKTDESIYFEKDLPEAFCDAAATYGFERYDLVVVDEGQDLLRYEYLMCFDQMVKGGLKEGEWHIAYDPFQNIYNPELQNGLDLLKDFAYIKLKLDTNCRNTRPIGIQNMLMTGVPPAKTFKVDGLGVEVEAYEDSTDQRIKLLKRVRNLLGQGAKPGSIQILSSRRFENSCMKGENLFKGICKFQDVTNLIPKIVLEDALKFCTIHSFKGLEAAIIILIDVEGFEDTDTRLLNYIAMSRAKSLLYVFYNKFLEDERNKMIAQSSRYITEMNLG